MNNIKCLIEDIDSSTSDNSWTSVDLKTTDTNSKNDIIDNEIYALELNYKLNYTTKYLGHILDYYNISKSKLNKETMIRKLVEFEININNYNIVYQRKRLFENIEELKNDQYFKKFILWKL